MAALTGGHFCRGAANRATRGGRPHPHLQGAPPLDPATFEKAGETFDQRLLKP